MTMNLLHLQMKVMRLMMTHLMVKVVKEERMVMEILHHTLQQLKVCDNTHCTVQCMYEYMNCNVVLIHSVYLSVLHNRIR